MFPAINQVEILNSATHIAPQPLLELVEIELLYSDCRCHGHPLGTARKVADFNRNQTHQAKIAACRTQSRGLDSLPMTTVFYCALGSCLVPAGRAVQVCVYPSESPAMEMTEIENYKRQLGELRVEHRDLDQVIIRLSEDPLVDELQLKRLKKRKLMLKDMITHLENKLIPDLNA